MHHGMKTNGALSGGHGGLSSCGAGGPASLERVRYFSRQLITPDDLTQEQEYFRSRMRRHNRLLHGWGVVCGLEVKPTAEDWTVCIEPGYALSPQGDEILVDRALKLDLSRQGLDGNAASSCGDDLDPWCSTVRTDPRGKDPLFIAIAYTQCMARPVRVQPAGCGCEGAQCEYSRVRDGYQVHLLDHLPASYADLAPPKDPLGCPQSGVRQCPDCVDEPWVILAKVDVGDKSIVENDINNHDYRRYVVSFGSFWFSCGQPKTATSLKVANVILRQANPTAPTAPGIQVFNLAESGASFPLTGPVTVAPTSTGAQATVSEIEVVFSAPPDKDSLKDGASFSVRRGTTQLQGTIEVAGASARWRTQTPIRQPFVLTLLGGGSTPITLGGQPLDGEPTQLPSGDGSPGGDFVLTVQFP